MKKFIKVVIIICVIFAVLLIGGAFTLYMMYPPTKLKAMAQDYVKQNFNREIDFDHIGLALVGVKIKKFAISEVSSFEQGTFISADTLEVKLELRPLLNKKVEIKTLILDGVEVNIIKGADGKFNFDDLLQLVSAPKETTEQSAQETSSLDLLASIISLKNSNFYYTDKQSNMNFSLNNVSINVRDFTLDKIFGFEASLETSFKMPNIILTPVKINLTGNANLSSLDMANASVAIKPLTLAYRNASISLNGNVKDFNNPTLFLEGDISGIDDKVIKTVKAIDLPSFTLPAAKILIAATANLDNNNATITQANLTLGNSYIKSTATVDFSKEELGYNLSTNFDISLTEIYQNAKEMLKELAPAGNINGNFKVISDKKMPNVAGLINLKNVGLLIVGKELRNFNGSIIVTAINDIKTNIMTGIFDNSNFKTFLSYAQPAKPVNVDFMLSLDKFTLDDINFDTLLSKTSTKGNASTGAEEVAKTSEGSGTSFSGIFNINADVSIKEVSNNVLTAKDLVFKANITNFDSMMDKLNGTITFSSKDGEIRDINKLMNSSKLLRVTFASIRVVQKVFSIAKLDKLSMGTNDIIKYSLIDGQYTIKNGLVNLDKSTIESDILTVKASGSVNLVNEDLAMIIDTHFGKVTSSGFKPVVIKVNGTMSDPKYKVDVLSTVTSVLTVPKSVVKGGVNISTSTVSGTANAVKNVASSIGSLFKKK